jgi:Ser/Thr protein kinase RdoA (MazF antagonist)
LNNQNTPYNQLDPSLILDAIESVGFPCTGSLLALNSYENRVYQVGIDEAEPLIAKFYRPNRWTNAAIIEEHQFSLELVSHDIPVIAPLAIASGATMHEYQGFRFALFPRRGGRTLELENVEQLEWMGRFIGRLHAVGATRPFQQRLRLDVQSYGFQPYQFLIENNFIPAELKAGYCHTVDAILKKITDLFAQSGPIQVIRLHGDCHPGNVLWNNGGPQIVDLDDCLMGPAIQDLWMLLSGGSEQETRAQLNIILQGYLEFNDFNYREIALIDALRTLRMIHYSAWLAKRWEDPAFPLNFPWFNTPRYWQEQLQNLKEQLYNLDSQNSDYESEDDSDDESGDT